MKKLFVISILFISSDFASAGQNMSFEQLKDACLNPAKYHSQVQPTDIKIDCADRQYTWVQAADDSLTMPTQRTVGFAVSSNKYTVPLSQNPVEIAPVGATCPVLKQIEETLTISQSLTCDQLLAGKENATELCTKMIDQMRAENAAAIAKKETGKEIHLCAAQNQKDEPVQQDQRGQRGQRGQRKSEKQGTQGGQE